jgi:hypothetical protein
MASRSMFQNKKHDWTGISIIKFEISIKREKGAIEDD